MNSQTHETMATQHDHVLGTQHQHHNIPLGHCRAQLEALYTEPLPVHHNSTVAPAPLKAQVHCSGHCRAQQCELYTPDQPRRTLEEKAGEDEEKWECADGEVGRWKVVVEEEGDVKATRDANGN
jgi:hypothetical protein